MCGERHVVFVSVVCSFKRLEVRAIVAVPEFKAKPGRFRPIGECNSHLFLQAGDSRGRDVELLSKSVQ